MALPSWLAAGWRIVSRLLGRSLRSWGEHARQDPQAAAHELELVAGLLEARARAFRRQDGWRARRNREWAVSLRAQAEALRDERQHAAACAAVPTQWTGAT